MKLFTGIDARRGDQTIGAAFRIIGKRVKALPPPRSLCEVGADSEDSHWLCTWAWSLQPQTALKWLTEYRRGAGDNAPVALSQVIGSLFLFLAAEAARREAREGYVWPAVHEKFQSETRRLLFAQGQPTQLYKEAIEVAAHLLKLRHVFGLEGTQNYYVSIYIQFGFTQKGLAQLPFWLAGHVQIGVAGAARFTEGGWETLNPRGELTVQDAQTYTYKLFLPSLWVGERLQELALLEGST